jgi:hypothetical protein
LALDRFRLLAWSKEKMSEEKTEEELLEAFKKRYGKALPINAINMVFVTDVSDKTILKQEDEVEGGEAAE